VGDNRPVAFCTFNTPGTMIATAGWSGLCNVWSVPACKELRKLRGHVTNASCIKFHPTSGLPGHETSVVNLASSAHDGTVYLWDLETCVCCVFILLYLIVELI
jgi:WD40 repeat protein